MAKTVLILMICLLLYFPFKSRADLDDNSGNYKECSLPSACHFQKVNTIIDASGIERILGKDKHGLRCNIDDEFKFDFNISDQVEWIFENLCFFKVDSQDGIIELRWPKNSDTSTFDTNLNIRSLFDFITIMYQKSISLNLVNVKRFGINITNFDEIGGRIDVKRVLCTNCRFDFYMNRKKTLKTCADFLESNVTLIESLFQMYTMKNQVIFGNTMSVKYYLNFTIINGDFQHPLCPLVFNDSYIGIFQLIGLVDSFYKRNILSFSNHTFGNFTSRVKRLQLDKAENVNLDFKLLNPNVFKEIESIYIYGSINRIDEAIFKSFKGFKLISFKTNYFRKIMHKNGINWIKTINSDVKVDVSNETIIFENNNLIKFINLDCFYYSQALSMPTVFPDEDFCLYVDYPFDQLVLMIQLCGYDVYFAITPEFSCTYLWLIQYNRAYYQTFYTDFFMNMFNPNRDPTDILSPDFMINVVSHLNSSNYYASFTYCNFTSMKRLCNKSQYSVRDTWGLYDYYVLNKKMEIAFKISNYVFSFLGIITNLIVIITILHKDNTDIFKGFKQYDYVFYNSIFSLLILVIELMSWMSECFYPYEVFCPEIRKLVFFQMFKILFKECFITAFRFMCNFTYVGFALNRISLIGKDHGKLVQFMSEVGVKSFIAVCLMLSFCFSVVKYFKYEINYDQPESSYPVSNEHDISSIHRTHISNDGVIITNSVFDLLNYVAFEVIIFIFNIYMVVLLKQVLGEKLKNSETLMGQAGKKKLDAMKKENEDAVNKVIKMVILNTAISVLFKLPIAFIPVVNVVAEFYYKNYLNQFKHPKFGEFYSFLMDSGFYDFIVNCSDSLFNFSLFIQLFIYFHFDKKFKMAFRRIQLFNDKEK